ncbi:MULTISPECIES: flagellar export chaperone FliS [Aneurinibacillus]|uniref:flagellar export chaperone FliS n=1 Tax=Aneurinibacillus TaxID=55079 RepID=UPI0006973442|nr:MULTISPECIES: flagellar protein FliS [Aneurinibacillus]MCP1357557.1 flagellar protein FliS [Aneurinibacillus migulanus]MED0670792.1 flagellar protein FliS [Aneurinibacillus aneurinilyticus]CEH30576.1 Putative flagellar protein FliS [Aneurinibacillus migulanus]
MERVVTLENVELSDIHDRPELITSLLYKKFLQKIEEAIAAMSEHKYDRVNSALQLCNDIVTRLGFGIKYEAGVLADRLEMLYQYVFDLILAANYTKDTAKMREAKKIMEELDGAWTTAMEKVRQSDSTASSVNSGMKMKKPSINPYERMEIDQETLEKAQANPREL